jgi:hypothetical protein
MKAVEDDLYFRDLIIMSSLDQAYITRGNDNAGNRGFHSSLLSVIRQLLVTGDVLCRVNDDLTIRQYRNDHYVTVLTPSLRVKKHITLEKVDPVELSDEKLGMLGINRAEAAQKSYEARLKDLYTEIVWDERSNRWTIRQEVDGKIISETTRKISPYICVATSVMPGSNYGRAFMTRMLPEINAYDALVEAGLECAAVCADVKWALDKHSQTREEDLLKPPLSIVRTDVRDGRVTDVAVLQGQVGSGYSVIQQAQMDLARNIARAFLLQDEMIRQSERTTAAEVQALITQLNQSLGSLYTPIADSTLGPLAYIAQDILMRQSKLPKLSQEVVDMTQIRIMTGSAAIARRQQADSIIALTRTASELQLMSHIDSRTVLTHLARALGVSAPTLIKSEQQVAAEAQQAARARIQEQASIEANAQAAAAMGGVVQDVAAQQLAPQG